ncbi:GND [Symbiodinium sp. CCMP2592]|nr:GND [Symbiodinium sp. CCMP2592]
MLTGIGRKRTDFESGTSSESESDGYPAPGQMAYARPMQPPVPGQGQNPYWQGSAPQGPPQPAPYAGAAYATGAPYLATSFVQGSPQAYPQPFQSGEGFAWAGFGSGGFMGGLANFKGVRAHDQLWWFCIPVDLNENPVTLSFVARDATGRTVVDQSAPITLQAVTARPGRRLEEEDEEEEETKEVAMRGLDSRRRSSFSSPRRRISSPRRRTMTDSRRRAVLDSRRRAADTSPRRRVMADTRRRSSFFSPRRRRGGSGSFVPNNHYSNPLSPSIGHYGYTNPNYAYHNYGGHMPMSTSYGYTGANAYSSGSGMKIALAGGAGILAGLATSHLLHHYGGSNSGGYTHAQMMQQDCTYGSWSGTCNSCYSQYGANRCALSISPNFDATRDDLMSTGFIPTQVSWPLTVTVTSVSGIDFNPASVCPLTPDSAGNPSMARLFLTTTSLGMGSSGGNPGPGYSPQPNYGQQTNYGPVQSSSSSGSGFFAWLGTVLALCCCCGFCVCCSCASGKKPSKWGFSGDSSSSDSDESVQMVHHGGHNPYWHGQAPAPAPAQTNTAFMDTAAPGGATWANYCRGPPEVNPSTGFVAGRWGDCLAWAVVYEHQNPGWPQNPTYRDMGPAGTVIQAMLENAADSDCEDVERAANQLENACRKAVASGGTLPVINCRA